MSEEEEPEEERPRSRLAGYAALAVAGAAYEASRRRKLAPKLGENEVTPERTSIGVRFAPPAGTFVSSGSFFQLTYRASFAPTGLWGAVDMYYDDGGRQTFTLTKPASFTTNRTSVNVPFQGKVSSAGTVVSATIGGETPGIRRGEFYGILLAITPVLPEGKILAQGYIYDGHNLVLGENVESGPGGGPGNLRYITTADPAAGAEVSMVATTVPNNALWRPISYTVVMAQGLTQTPRPGLRFLNTGTVLYCLVVMPADVAVSTTVTCSWARGGVQNANNVNGGSMAAIMPEILLGETDSLGTLTEGIGANSNYDNGRCLGEEWLVLSP